MLGQRGRMASARRDTEEDLEDASDPSPQERLATKNKLRETLRRVEEKEKEGRADPGFYSDVLKELQSSAANVKYAPEAAIDADVVLRLLRMAVDDAQKSTVGQASLNPAQLMAAIRRMALADEAAEDEDDGAAAGIDLRRLFPLVGKLVPTMAPKVNFMLGPLSYIPEKKAPVRRAAAEKYDASQAARPTEGIDPSKKHEEITTKTVARLHTIVTRLRAPMCLYTFAVDPRDNGFAQTVENFFHLAFLIKQGTAAITLDARGLPVVGPTATGAAGNDEALLTHRKQVVMSLTMQQWKDIVRVFEVRQSYIQAELARMDREGEDQADADAADENDDDDDEDDDDEDEPPRRRRR